MKISLDLLIDKTLFNEMSSWYMQYAKYGLYNFDFEGKFMSLKNLSSYNIEFLQEKFKIPNLKIKNQDEIVVFDERGNLKEITDERRSINISYDDENRKKKIEYSNGDIEFYFYDMNNNLIKWEDNSGDWRLWKYEGNNLIEFQTSYGYWQKYFYSENEKRMGDSDGYWQRTVFNKQGNEIYFENSDHFWRKYKYDNQGNLIHFQNANYYEEFWTYDEDAKLIEFKDSTDKMFNLVYEKNKIISMKYIHSWREENWNIDDQPLDWKELFELIGDN